MFRVQALGFRVAGSGSLVVGLGSRIRDSGFQVGCFGVHHDLLREGLELKVISYWFMV